MRTWASDPCARSAWKLTEPSFSATWCNANHVYVSMSTVAFSSAAVEKALGHLARYGILLESDSALPSVTGLVAGGPVKGSWWGHPRGHEIFRVLSELAEHPDVLVSKLVCGKVTLVDRKLWPAVFAVGAARESWQLAGLGPAARALLRRVDKNGRAEASGEAARELEKRLLVHSEQIHTEAGSHAKILETWQTWAKQVGLAPGAMAIPEAKAMLTRALSRIDETFGAKGRLPWPHDSC